MFRGEPAYISDREKFAMSGSWIADWLDPVEREHLLDYLRRAGTSVYLLVPLFKDGMHLLPAASYAAWARPMRLIGYRSQRSWYWRQ